MSVVELSHAWLEARVSGFKLIRDFRTWRAYRHYDHYLVVDDIPGRRAIVFIYTKQVDRDADAEVIRRLADGGEDSAEVPAWLNPGPPSRSASDARAIPEDFAA